LASVLPHAIRAAADFPDHEPGLLPALGQPFGDALHQALDDFFFGSGLEPGTGAGAATGSCVGVWACAPWEETQTPSSAPRTGATRSVLFIVLFYAATNWEKNAVIHEHARYRCMPGRCRT
jgi:hypothetical protein